MSDFNKDVDYYKLLDLNISCTEKDIRSAYRKKALKYHPDKNPDDAKAAETFHLLSKAIEILLNKTTRDTYDKIIKRKEEIKIQNNKLDSVRKKFKDDLERREKEAENEKIKRNTFGYNINKTDEQLLIEEIDRLRKEGSIRLQEEIKLMNEEIKLINTQEDQQQQELSNVEKYRLKVKWLISEHGQNNDDKDNSSIYNEINLNQIFSKYGKINFLIINNNSTKKSSSKKKYKTCLIEYENIESAKQAKLYEIGLPNNKLNISYLDKNLEEENVKNSNRSSTLFPSSSQSSMLFPSSNSQTNTLFPSSNSQTSTLFPSSNHSSSLFPSSNRQSSTLFTSSNSQSSTLFTSSNHSSTLFPSSKSSVLFPSSSNLSSKAYSNKTKESNFNSKSDLDYEEMVLNQMRKAQTNQQS